MSMPCCRHKVDCGVPGNLDFDSPYANLTSETPDIFTFASIAHGNRWIPPRIGSLWSSDFCVGVCESAISQEDADLCAARMSELLCQEVPPPDCVLHPELPECHPPPPECVVHPELPECNPPPCCDPPITPPYAIFYNQQILASAECPDGTHFVYVFPAGQFVAQSQAMADRQAATYALRQARLARICIGDFDEFCCNGIPYLSIMTPLGGSLPLLAQIISGSLPPGIVMSMGGDLKTVILSGIPSTTGIYDFVLRVSDTFGHYIQKAYTITVGGIANPSPLPEGDSGTAYSQNLTADHMGVALLWEIAAGTLPPGLTLNSASGEISGIPTTDGDYNFIVRVSTY